MKKTQETSDSIPVKKGPDQKSGAKNEAKAVDLSKLRIGTIVHDHRYGEGKVTGIKPGKLLVSFEEVQKMYAIPLALEKGALNIIEW